MFKSQSSLVATATILSAVLLGACGTVREASDGSTVTACSPCPTCSPCGNGAATGATPPASKTLQAAQWSELPGWQDDNLAAAWPAFLQSCRGLIRQAQWSQWKSVCEEAKGIADPSTSVVRRFIESRLQPWRVVNPDGSQNGLVTGYYEPLLNGSRTRGKPYLYPVLGVPADLLTVDLGAVQPEVRNIRLRGRLQGNKVVPYYSRAEITSREKEYADRTLLWVDDPVDLFFLHVQGSGRVKLREGGSVRLGYADQNGHVYQSIGRLLVERGELTADQASMPAIKQWARANPTRLAELLNGNPSYVFFREQPVDKGGKDGEGPSGALGVPLTAERSIAIDPRYLPLGAPVFLSTSHPESATPLRRLVMAQDTGGAIRGAVRADIFYGFGDKAGSQAGRMKQPGRMWVLLPPSAAPGR